MTEKRKSIYDEIEQLTNDNPENYLVSSYAGKLGLRGKFIRDSNGKLIPVLLNIKNLKSPPLSIWSTITDTSTDPKREEIKATWYKKAFQKGCTLLGFKTVNDQKPNVPSLALKTKS